MIRFWLNVYLKWFLRLGSCRLLPVLELFVVFFIVGAVFPYFVPEIWGMILVDEVAEFVNDYVVY